MLWCERDPGRLLEEFERMNKYTNAELRAIDGEHLPGSFGTGLMLAWEERITSNSGKKYKILMVCRQNHPYSAPVVWLLEPKIGRCHHMLPDGSLCLHEPSIGPDKAFVLNIRNWACEWIDCYETRDWRTPSQRRGGKR